MKQKKPSTAQSGCSTFFLFLIVKVLLLDLPANNGPDEAKGIMACILVLLFILVLLYKYRHCYISFRGVWVNYAEAVKWYREAAERGDTNAKKWLREHNESEE